MSKTKTPTETKATLTGHISATQLLEQIRFQDKYKIAIIGSGISGQGVLKGILFEIKKGNIPPKAVVIDLFEERYEFFYKGIAYNNVTNNLEHNININIESMNIYGNFNKWLRENHEKVLRYIEEKFKNDKASKRTRDKIIDIIKKVVEDQDLSFFPPRFIYGLYLEDNARAIATELQNMGVKINYHAGKFESVTKLKNNKFVLKSTASDMEETHFNSVAIAVGGYRPTKENYDFFAFDPAIKETFINKLEAKSPGEKVDIKILGSGLTAIDMVKTLKEGYRYLAEHDPQSVKGKEVSVTLVSREALLPRVRVVSLDYQNKFLTLENTIMFIASKKDEDSVFDFLSEALQNELQAAYAEFKIKPNHQFDLHRFVEYCVQTNSMDMLKLDMKKSENDQEYRLCQTVYRNCSFCINFALENIKNDYDKAQVIKFKSIHNANFAPVPKFTIKQLLPKDGENITVKTSRVIDDTRSNDSYDITIDATGREIDLNLHPIVQQLKADSLIDDQGNLVSGISLVSCNALTTSGSNRSLASGEEVGKNIISLAKTKMNISNQWIASRL